MDYNKELFYKDFVRRESEFIRAPYDPEVEFYNSIKSGDVNYVRQLLEKEKFIDKKGLGTLSKNYLQNMKYHFAITAAQIARLCINGGMDIGTSYGLSDYYIQKADEAKSLEEISELHPKMCEDYTKRMKNIKKQTVCSKPVSAAMDYIYDNLHKRIFINDLADYLKINPSYLSRIFKKETGETVTDYIKRQKLETAKNMLLYSALRPAEIAQILAFPSQSYFNDVFKKYTGLTPSEFRRPSDRKRLHLLSER